MYSERWRTKWLEEFVGRTAKMYAFRVHSKDKQKAKGIKKCVVDRERALIIAKNACSLTRVNLIRNYTRDVYSIETNKLALS
jgi:hypothetical protein